MFKHVGTHVDTVISTALSGAINKFLVSLSSTGVIYVVTHQLLPTLVSGLASALVYLVSNVAAATPAPAPAPSNVTPPVA